MKSFLAGSHLPLLSRLLENTTGPMLELGMGYFSTPILYWYSMMQNRPFLSYENDHKWFNKVLKDSFPDGQLVTSGDELIFYDNMNPCEFHQINDWSKIDIDTTHWSIVLIDHRPALRRKVDALRLKDKADYIVLHDSEPEINKFYGYQNIYKHFKYVYHFTKLKPNTTVLSNFEDLTWLKHLES